MDDVIVIVSFFRTSVESMISRLGNVRLLQNTKFHCSCRVSLRCSSCCNIRTICIVNVWMLLSLALALFVPTIKDIISPLGSLAAMFVFVLPGKFVHSFMLYCVAK